MQITHLGHSCLLVEVAGARLLIDPGSYSTGFEGLTGLDAVLVTHQHADHVDVDRLTLLLAANDSAALVAEAQTAAQLTDKGIPAETLAPEDERRVGAARVRAVGGRHAVIHADIPRVGNVGLLVDDAAGGPVLFHPGDAYEVTPSAVDLLAVPLSAPWAAVKETVDFVRAVAPQTAFPIHDGLLTPAARAMYLGHVTRLAPEVTMVRDLAAGGAVEMWAG